MQTIKIYKDVDMLGKQLYSASLLNVKSIVEVGCSWSIILSCGTEVVLPSSAIFTIEDSK